MSRRASLFAKQNPGKPRVRFPDELVFNDNVKEQDIPAVEAMLRRSSLQMDINSINSAGLTPLHQAVLDGNLAVTKLLVSHGADVNKQDEDFWTPLHAACAEGHSEIVRFLLSKGADRHIMTDNGERPLDLVEPTDFSTIKVMLEDVAAKSSPTSDTDEDDEEGARQEDEEEEDEEETEDKADEDEEDENIKGKSRILDDEDVMGDLEYISPEEDEDSEGRRRRQRRSGAESYSGSGSERGNRFSSGGEDLDDYEYGNSHRRHLRNNNRSSGERDDDDYYRNDHGRRKDSRYRSHEGYRSFGDSDENAGDCVNHPDNVRRSDDEDRRAGYERHRSRDSDENNVDRCENRRDFAQRRSDDDASDGSTGFRRRRDQRHFDSGSEDDKIDRRRDIMPTRHSDRDSPRYTSEDERFALYSDGNNNSNRSPRYDYSSDDEKRHHQRRPLYDSDERALPDSQDDRGSRSDSRERQRGSDSNSEAKSKD